MKKTWIIPAGVLVLAFLMAATGDNSGFQVKSGQGSARFSAPQAAPDFGRIPLYFIPNQGRLDSRVAFFLQGNDKTVYFTSEGVTIALADSTGGKKEKPDFKRPEPRRDERPERWVVKLDFVGARAGVTPEGEAKTEAVISYFKGKPGDWRKEPAAYSRIIYRDLWPGIDLVYSGMTDKLKYEFIVHPGADPSRVRLAYRGASGLKVNHAGELVVETPLEGFKDGMPAAYQEAEGRRDEVAIRYDVAGREYGFRVGAYDKSRTLVLDPVILVYCGFVGGSGSEYAQDIAIDGSGCAYITGYATSTESLGFPVLAGPDLSHNGGTYDAFVAKINASGTALVYCGYIGGTQSDFANGIAVDGSGCAYIAGSTVSTETQGFPLLIGPDLSYNGGTYDAFVAKVNPSGTALAYCGYIGGADYEEARGIAVTSAGTAYVVGFTKSSQASFPVGAGMNYNGGIFQGLYDAFVAKVAPTGASLSYCRYVGGTGNDYGWSIALDSTNNPVIVGETFSDQTSFPRTTGPNHQGGSDAFIAYIEVNSGSLYYCRYVGGTSTENGTSIAVDRSNNVYVAGATNSSPAEGFPVTVGPGLVWKGQYDAFVAKLDPTLSSIVYCGYIGGVQADYGHGIAVDSAGSAYVVGYTASNATTDQFPVLAGPDLSFNGNNDAFVAKVKPDGTGLVYCGYIGGSNIEHGYDIAVDAGGTAYVIGQTYSSETTFPVIGGPDLTYNGLTDAFVAKIAGDRKKDLLGTWDGQGVYYRSTDTGSWTSLASPADMIACGDLYGDSIDDLIGVWSGQSGVWAKNSANGGWTYLGNTPRHIASGDMNGDGRVDLLGTWDGQGVFYKDSISGAWTQMATPATLITAGDLDGDRKADLIGIWPSQAGVWVKYSQTGNWSSSGVFAPGYRGR